MKINYGTFDLHLPTKALLKKSTQFSISPTTSDLHPYHKIAHPKGIFEFPKDSKSKVLME